MTPEMPEKVLVETKTPIEVRYNIFERAVNKIGYPILVGTFFMLLFLGVIPSPLSHNSEKLDAHMAVMDKHQKLTIVQTQILAEICQTLGGKQCYQAILQNPVLFEDAPAGATPARRFERVD